MNVLKMRFFDRPVVKLFVASTITVPPIKSPLQLDIRITYCYRKLFVGFTTFSETAIHALCVCVYRFSAEIRYVLLNEITTKIAW